jgi:hypothetical protein
MVTVVDVLDSVVVDGADVSGTAVDEVEPTRAVDPGASDAV